MILKRRGFVVNDEMFLFGNEEREKKKERNVPLTVLEGNENEEEYICHCLRARSFSIYV